MFVGIEKKRDSCLEGVRMDDHARIYRRMASVLKTVLKTAQPAEDAAEALVPAIIGAMAEFRDEYDCHF